MSAARTNSKLFQRQKHHLDCPQDLDIGPFPPPPSTVTIIGIGVGIGTGIGIGRRPKSLPTFGKWAFVEQVRYIRLGTCRRCVHDSPHPRVPRTFLLNTTDTSSTGSSLPGSRQETPTDLLLRHRRQRHRRLSSAIRVWFFFPLPQCP